jgi:hypothetical protein
VNHIPLLLLIDRDLDAFAVFIAADESPDLPKPLGPLAGQQFAFLTLVPGSFFSVAFVQVYRIGIVINIVDYSK